MSLRRSGDSLARNAGVENDLVLNPSTEITWIEIIQKMESVYADLVHSQVQVEEKNAALEEAHQFIQSVLMSMTDILVACDLRGRIQQVNRALETLTGRPGTDILGQPLSSLFANESRERIEGIHRRSHQDMVDCEVSLLDQDGASVPLAVNCSDRYDASGKRVGLVLIGRPIGELQRAYQDLNKAHKELKQTQMQLVHSEKMASLGRLVAGVAHELNNPISFVFGNMHALQKYGERINRYLAAADQGIDPQSLLKLRDELKIAHIMNDMNSLINGTLEGAERVRDIVQDLRRYSTAQQEAESTFDLVEIIRTAVQWVTKACRRKPDIAYEVPQNLHVTGRKGHVHQILVNLVQNAVDVIEDQDRPRISVTCCATDLFAEITVHDSGPGIAEPAFARLFDPFYTTKPVGKGTGLGLSISYGLATDLGGTLRAQNHPQGGALFTLSLPLKGNADD